MPEIKDEFDDIVAQLLEERPQIDPTFARDLDAKAAAGFPRRRRLPFPSVKWNFPMWVPAGGLAAVVAVVIGISAAGGGSSDDSSGSSVSGATVATVSEGEAGGDTATEEAPATGFDNSGGGSSASEPSLDQAAPAPKDVTPLSSGEAARESAGAGTLADPSASNVAPTSPPPLGRERLQELSASVTLEAPSKDIDDVNAEILQVTNAVGGFVVSSNVRSTDGESGGGNYVLRIPVDRLNEGLTRLSRLGHVRERSQGIQDITSERNVARENLQEYKAMRISLLKRIAAADTDAEVAALRAELRGVNSQIGAYRGQLRNVERRASFAQVSLTLVADDKSSAADDKDKDDQWAVGDAFDDAGRVLEVVAGIAVIVLAILIPLLMAGAAILATRRVLGRRGRERALDAI
jgi:hypothetical protein